MQSMPEPGMTGQSVVAQKERRIILRGPKTNELRTIPINETLLQGLRKLPRHIKSDCLFWSKDRGGKRYIDVGEAFETP